MQYIERTFKKILSYYIDAGKSILLLGPRQTGKTTLIDQLQPDLKISLVLPRERQRYEKNPSILYDEVKALPGSLSNKKATKWRPLVVIDEVQKVPALMDVVQVLLDEKLAQCLLTGSSARKLRHGASVNLLPGRLVALRLDPLMLSEIPDATLDDLIFFGTLPPVFLEKKKEAQELLLSTYVETYLEEEVRAEALARNIGNFARFLELAAAESGNILNFRSVGQELGISHTTVASYYEILEDCLILERVEPITKSLTRKKLSKASKYLFFDMGVRRLCAREGVLPPQSHYGKLFEEWVGLELIRHMRAHQVSGRLRFWRDAEGPEVDWVVDVQGSFIPIEVKWTENPREQDVKHIKIFLSEYREARNGFVICRTPRPLQLCENIMALPWKEIGRVFPNQKAG